MIVVRETTKVCLYWATVPPLSVRPQHSNTITFVAIKTRAVVIMVEVGGVKMEIVVDSGSSLSIVRKEVLHQPN